MKEGRTTQVSIRLTEEERERIRRCADRAHLKEAAYIRDLALDQKQMILPEEVEVLLRQFLKSNLSVGQDINLAARRCAEMGSFSEEQYRELTAFLTKMNSNYEMLYEQIMEVMKSNGDHEAAPPEGK